KSPVRLGYPPSEQAVAFASSLTGMWQDWQVVSGACAYPLCCHSENVRSIGNARPVSVPSASLRVRRAVETTSKPSAKTRSAGGGATPTSGEVTSWQLPHNRLSVWKGEYAHGCGGGEPVW